MSGAQDRQESPFLMVEWGNDLETKTVFCVTLHHLSDLLFYLLVVSDAAHHVTWGICLYKLLYHVCSSSILSPYFRFYNTDPTHTGCTDPMSLVCFLYSRGSDGDLVVRSDKVQLQCIN